MTSFFGLAVIAVMIGMVVVGLKADDHYRHLNTLGQQDYIRHVDDSEKYSGLELWSYQRGWNKQAVIYGDEL